MATIPVEKKSAFGAKPSGLAKPVPGAEEASEFGAFLNSLPEPDMPAPQEDEAVPPQDQASEFDAALAASAAPQEEIPIEDVPTVQPETFDQRRERTGSVVQAAKEVVGDSIARFKASWGVTDREKVGKLKEIYGDKGVRQASDGTIQVKRPGEKGFRDFDPDTFELVNDVLDFSRDAVEGSVELGGRVGGGVAGAGAAAPAGAVAGGVAGLPTGPGALATAAAGAATTGAMGAIAGQAAGGAAGAVGGLELGDWIAEHLVGIERDPTRDWKKEALTVGSIAAGVGSVFGAASNYLAKKRIAAEARKASLSTKEVFQTAQEVQEAADSLAKNGIQIAQGKRGMVLSPGQIAGDLAPEAKNLDFELSEPGPVRDFFVQQGKLVENAWVKLRQGISNVAGKPEDELFKSIKGASKSMREVEGKTIGTFRDEAMKLSKGQPKAMQRTTKELPNLLNEFGFQAKQEMRYGAQKELKMVSPSVSDLQEMFPDATPAVLGKVKYLISDLNNSLMKNGGALPLKETDRIYNQFRDTIDSFWGSSSGGAVAERLINIKNALRDDWTQHIGAELNGGRPGALQAYETSLKKYSDILNAQNTLKNVLKKNDISASAFADVIFSPGAGKDRVQQMKTLIGDADPKLWNQLVDKHVENMQRKAINPKTDRMDWKRLSKQFDDLERSEIANEMMDPATKENMKNFFKIAEKVDSTFDFKEGKPVDKSTLSKVRNMVVVLGAPVSFLAKLSTGQNMAQSAIESIGKDRALVRWLNGEGLELVLKDLPKQEQTRLRNVLVPMIAKGALATGMAGPRRDMGVKAGKAEENAEEIPEE